MGHQIAQLTFTGNIQQLLVLFGAEIACEGQQGFQLIGAEPPQNYRVRQRLRYFRQEFVCVWRTTEALVPGTRRARLR